MFENPFLYKYMSDEFADGNHQYPPGRMMQKADDLFRKVWLKGSFFRWWSRLLGRKYQLLDLLDQKLDHKIICRHFCGIRIIPLNQIKGSENRSADFDAHFNPLKSEDRERWVEIALLILLRGNFEAVNLIQIENIFFVRDGHHRVSVARALGAKYIDAEVTVWQING